ncbi:MAG: hypothetical protein COS95_02135 [Ignavibacteriales bacterium CG07_land_8_20_14_0_80_59_12]|nr:MAG: hypothetical protein COS95_02135 [Ignavibacteriales bacterium CG07_land_8_20_14_0_80_59_12]
MSLILRGAHIVTPFRLEEHSTLTIDGDTITALGSDADGVTESGAYSRARSDTRVARAGNAGGHRRPR